MKIENERPKPEVQFGISSEADFEQNAWTFLFPNDYAVWAGEFAILEADKYRQLAEQNKELLEAMKEIAEANPLQVGFHEKRMKAFAAIRNAETK